MMNRYGCNGSQAVDDESSRQFMTLEEPRHSSVNSNIVH